MAATTFSTSIEPRPEFAGILKDQDQFGTGRDTDAADRINSWFDTLMLQCGWGMSPTVVLLLCILSAMALGGIVFVAQENLLTTAFAGMMGFLIPIGAAMWARSRRQTLLLNQLPPMLEELARAAKTGRSVEQCLHLVATDTPKPLGDELQLVSRRVEMGVTLNDAMADLPYRTGLMTLNLLRTTLVVQQQTGGDLVTVLNRLSRTVRDRLQYLGRLRAATAASRATAILMVLIPPAVLTFFLFRDPAYFSKLFSSAWGRNATLMAIALEIIGALWVFRILQDSQRT
ncbi:MAG TPA: type II secretion system F family protein [Planctomycetaceae bacterium]|jgi:tight adherence protein B|nr:type II secretion system F family protein [Planctomycetaceae bacterium]